MTDDRYDSLTQKHDEALARLEAQESNSKKNRNYLLVTALTALVGGAGGGTALISNDDDQLKTAVATHAAVYEQWKPEITGDVAYMQKQITALRDAIIRLQTTAENPATGHHGSDLRHSLDEVRSLLEIVKDGGGGRREPAAAPAAERVQQLKGELFAD